MFTRLPLFLQVSQNQRYRFSLIIEELRKADATSYKTTLVAFINCILIATESLEERVRLRNELVGKEHFFVNMRSKKQRRSCIFCGKKTLILNCKLMNVN